MVKSKTKIEFCNFAILINVAAEIRMDWWEKRLEINKRTVTFIGDLSVCVKSEKYASSHPWGQ